MTKSLYRFMALSTCLFAAPIMTACATQNARDHVVESFSADDCKSYGALFNDPSLNRSLAGLDHNPTSSGGGGGLTSENAEDKLSWPWDKSQDARVSRDRAALRKVHKQKGCAD